MQSARQPPADLIALDEACRRYRIGRSTLYRLIAEGQLERWRERGDRRTKIPRAQLERALRARLVDERAGQPGGERESGPEAPGATGQPGERP